MDVRARVGLLSLVSALTITGCEPGPTDPGETEDSETPELAEPTPAAASRSMLTPGTFVLDEEAYRLVSTGDERARGLFRYELVRPTDLELVPGNIVLGALGDEGMYIRRVLTVTRDRGSLTLQTSQAYPSQALRSGRYVERFVVGDPIRTGGATLPYETLLESHNSTSVSVTQIWDPEPIEFEFDWCEGLEYIADEVEADNPLLADWLRSVELCNRGFPTTNCKAFAVRTVKVCGDVTEFRTTGSLEPYGEIGIGFTVDAGGLHMTDPGAAPTFSPCNTNPGSELPKCWKVDNWVRFVRDVLNAEPLKLGFPEDTPPPTYVCVPLGINGCTMSGGRSPEFELSPPSVDDIELVNGLGVDFTMTTVLSGRGLVELEIPIPRASFLHACRQPPTEANPTPSAFCEVKIGDFIYLAAETSDATLRFSQDMGFGYRFGVGWDSGTGWAVDDARSHSTFDLGFEAERPDTLWLRGGIRPLVFMRKKIIPALPWAVSGQVRLESNMTGFAEDTWSTAADCPETTPPHAPAAVCGTEKHDLDYVETTYQEASLILPLLAGNVLQYFVPEAPLENTFEYELLRLDIQDTYERGDLVVHLSTDGDPLVDPYGVLDFPGYRLDLGRQAPAGSGAFAPYAVTDPAPLDGDGNPHVLSHTFGGAEGSFRFSEHEEVDWLGGLFGTDPVRCRKTYEFFDQDATELFDCTLLAGVEQFVTVGRVGLNCSLAGTERIGAGEPGPWIHYERLRLNVDAPVERWYEVVCAPPVGRLRLTGVTTGEDLDVDGFGFTAGESAGVMPTNSSALIEDVRVGHHPFAVDGIAFNCVLEEAPSEVSVAYGQVTEESVHVGCASLIPALQAVIQRLADEGEVLRPAVVRSLMERTNAAQRSRERGGVGAVEQQLAALVRTLEAQRGRALTDAAVDELIADVRYILESGLLGS